MHTSIVLINGFVSLHNYIKTIKYISVKDGLLVTKNLRNIKME